MELDFGVLYPEVEDQLFLKCTITLASKVINYANGQRAWHKYLGSGEEHAADKLESNR